MYYSFPFIFCLDKANFLPAVYHNIFHSQLSLLLFHLSGEPIVMTIWSLIPLYKSIIVSVSTIFYIFFFNDFSTFIINNGF